MEALCEVFKKMTMDDYEIGEQYWVHVTHINTPHDFYCRPADFKFNMGLLERRGDKARTSELTPGKVIIYKSDKMNKYVRARVINIHQEGGKNAHHYDMLTLDYGCMEYRVSGKMVYKIENNILMPPTIINCRLANCEPLTGNTFDEDAILAMKTFVGPERARMLVKSKMGDTLSIELVNSCPDEIGTLLAITGHTSLACVANQAASTIEGPTVSKNEVKYPVLVVGDILHVRMQTGSTLEGFYVAKVAAYKRFIKERNNFTDYCHAQKELNAGNVKVGDIVGVLGQMTMKFERAVITQIKPNNRVVVQQLDWGNTIEVNLYQLRLISPAVFDEQPALAIYCTIEKSEMANAGLKACLHPGYEFFVKIIKLGNFLDVPHTVFITQLSQKSSE